MPLCRRPRNFPAAISISTFTLSTPGLSRRADASSLKHHKLPRTQPDVGNCARFAVEARETRTIQRLEDVTHINV
jgi:hypothetical protein